MVGSQIEVHVEGHAVAGGESRPYAVYKLLVREGTEEWRLERRWCARPPPPRRLPPGLAKVALPLAVG
jgi:hypothetical protein